MREKLTIEQFEQIKEQINSIIKQLEDYSEKHDKDDDFNEEEVSKNFLNQLLPIQNRLLSYDLSDIPFENWKGIELFSDETHAIDFSNTHANIDFAIFDYWGNGNFKGCNVRNLIKIRRRLNPSEFDEQTIKANQDIFLSDSFNNEFKDKFYQGKITIPDLATLPSDQLDEVIKKGTALYKFDYSGISRTLVNTLGIKKMVQLYNYSEGDFRDINRIVEYLSARKRWGFASEDRTRFSQDFENLLNQLKKIEISELKNTCFAYTRNFVIYSDRYYDEKEFPGSFVSENHELFLKNADVPDDVKDRFFSKRLKTEDLHNYPEAFRAIPIENYMDYPEIAKIITQKYGVGAYQEIVEKHFDVINYLERNYGNEKLAELIKNASNNDVEADFTEAVKKYYLNHLKPFNLTKVPADDEIAWLKSMNFKFITNSDNYDEIVLYDPHLIFLGERERSLIDMFGTENIRKLEEDIGFFSHKYEPNNYRGIEIFRNFALYFRRDELEKAGIDFKNGSLPYKEFLDQFAKFIDLNRKSGCFAIYQYDWIQGDFRTNHPELFIDPSAPPELRRDFYSYGVNIYSLRRHKDYLSHLRDKNLSNTIFDSMFLLLPGQPNSEGKATSYRKDFIAEYSKRYGNDKLLELMSNYGEILAGIDIPITNEEIIEDEQEIEKALRKAVYDRIVDGRYFEYEYLSNIKEMRKEHSDIFVDEGTPDRLKEKFYTRKIDPKDIQNNPKWKEFLLNKNLELVSVASIRPFIQKCKELKIGNDEILSIMETYGSLLIDCGVNISELTHEDCFDENGFNKEKLNAIIKEQVIKEVKTGQIVYKESDKQTFGKECPELFLDDNAPLYIKRKFYTRELSLKDISDSDLQLLFKKTNIAFGFSTSMSWLVSSTDNSDNVELNNFKVLKILAVYNSIRDYRLKNVVSRYFKNHKNEINADKIETIVEILKRLEYSNSIELRSFGEQIATLILNSDNPLEKLDTIEDVFLKNNLPLCGKMYLCFKTIYPSFSDVDNHQATFDERSRMAPGLKDDTLPDLGFHADNEEKRSIVTFNDLLRVSYRSNERSLIEYLDNIELGNKLFLELQNTNFDTSKLNDHERKVLEIFTNHLRTLYQNTTEGKKESIEYDKLSLEEQLKILSKKFEGNKRYDLKDRIVRSFCYYAGIKSYDELKNLIADSKKEQEERIEKVLKEIEQNGKFILHPGDLLRGIGDLEALSGSIGTGNFCKEHLGVFRGTSSSDTTPLDVDITLITREGDIYNQVKGTPTGFNFGGVYVIIKKDNPNIQITRDENGNLTQSKYDPRKIEVFGTKINGTGGFDTHWGARTGISIADVDCLLYKKRQIIDEKNPYDEKGNVNYIDDNNNYDFELSAIKYEIAKNGYYVPIIDFSGKLIYTKEEYKELRNKMQGLSHFGVNTYELSKELITPEVIEIAKGLNQESVDDTTIKRRKINAIIKEALEGTGLDLKPNIGEDLTEGTVELIDTGSTGRNTNVPYDGDFDFFTRLDAKIMRDSDKQNEIKQRIIDKLKQYDMESFSTTTAGDHRFKKVRIDDDTVVDIDLSYGVKTNKVSYSSDMCLKDRLETIKKLHPEEYKYVVANIILAKKILKNPKVNAYKPHRTDESQGGLGGIGIENWILQNGGSFTEACRTFKEAAFDKNGELVSFEEFKKKYEIWDFGENHFSSRESESEAEDKSKYLYDNFVWKNMNVEGYKKMATAIKEYLKDPEGFLGTLSSSKENAK